jgi:leucyl-tRNA synthetase
MSKYEPQRIEKKWQEIWSKQKLYNPNLDKAKKPFYNLMMFPYPSAEGLHVGNMYAFTGSDIFGRYKRMRGFDVFEPIGLDGFGIHSENYAIKVNKHPKELAKVSQENFYRQLHATGNAYDWDRTLETYNPDYYKWTQWIFIQLYKRGLAYRKKSPVNFCPGVCKTVLADEQVIDGKCERCGTEVEKRNLEQWLFKITEYADRLLGNLDKINWSEKVKIAQRNWIGKSEGLVIDFDGIEVFTTRPETADGATFLVISEDHPFAQELNRPKLELSQEKLGYFTGKHVKNPVTGEKIPVWVANYVTMEYGTGAIMAVPSEDERDREFAKKYDLPIVKSSLSAKPKGKKITNYHLRDWLISRQRYWGPPIPMIHCPSCAEASAGKENGGWFPVPEEELPVLLPDVKDWKPLGTGKSPLATVESFVNTKCPNCSGPAKRETDVSDTFLDSAWYFFRYISTEFDSKVFDEKRVRSWLPVHMYIGGAEHSVLHLLYARFLTMVFKDMGLIDFEEPFTRFYAHGLLIKEGAKMSKSKGNIVVPDDYIRKYGADTLRTYLMFLGPFNQGGDFYDSGIEGIFKFINRVWRLSSLVEKKDPAPEALTWMHRTISKVTDDMDNLRYNTAIAHLMEWYNFLSKEKSISSTEFETMLKLFAPFSPHFSEELWKVLGFKESIHLQKWPEFDEKFLKSEKTNIAVQVNGKLRGTIEINSNEVGNKERIQEISQSLENIKKHLNNSKPRKVIYVEGKVINFVS